MRFRVWGAIGTVVVFSATAFVVFTLSGGLDSDDSYSSSVQVYSNNVENLPQKDKVCDGDWDELVSYMRDHGAPDIYFVQQVSDQDMVDTITEHMTDVLGQPYAGILADVDQKPQRNGCGPESDGEYGREKQHQANAVIYREDRFAPAKVASWQAQREVDGECVNEDRPRTVAVKILLRQSNPPLTVAASSSHWPTTKRDGPACAPSNVRELGAEMDEGAFESADIKLAGGDMNVRDREEGEQTPWHEQMTGFDSWRDVIWEKCEARPDCLDENWTRRSDPSTPVKRIDFIFAHDGGRAAEIVDAGTVAFSAADATDDDDDAGCQTSGFRGCHYSEHRAVHAMVTANRK